MQQKILLLVATLALLFGGVRSGIAQGTAFTYQGQLTDGGKPANGNYDLQFTLFDAAANGAQAGSALTNNATAANGLFTLELDFGTNVFTGAARWLEIGVRTNGSASPYTVLTPRQHISSTPYAVRSLVATVADTATSATQLGGVAADQYIRSNDARLSDPRPASPGSTNYIQNSSTTQDNATFSIGGNASLGGQLLAGQGVLANSSVGNAVTGIGGNAGVFGLGTLYGLSGQQDALIGSGAGVYGTTDSGGGFGVYGVVNTGTTNAGVYGKSIAMNGSGVLGQADSGANGYGVWGKAAQGDGVVGESSSGTGVYGKTAAAGGVLAAVKGVASDASGVGVMGQANGGSSAYGVYGVSASGRGVSGNSDTGQAVYGLSANGGTAIYGNNLGSNTKGYAGDFFGRVRVGGDLVLEGNGALRVSGAGVGTSTAAFIHLAWSANITTISTIIDHPLTNGDPNAILIVTPHATAFTHPVSVGYNNGKWFIQNIDGADMGTVSFNVLVIKP